MKKLLLIVAVFSANVYALSEMDELKQLCRDSVKEYWHCLGDNVKNECTGFFPEYPNLDTSFPAKLFSKINDSCWTISDLSDTCLSDKETQVVYTIETAKYKKPENHLLRKAYAYCRDKLANNLPIKN